MHASQLESGQQKTDITFVGNSENIVHNMSLLNISLANRI